MPESPFLTEAEAAELLRLKEGTLNNWRLAGTGPPVIRVGPKGGKVLYDKEVLLAWVRERSEQPAAVGV